MFVYLSKKIAIPNNVKLQSLSWNKESGYLACGGDDGLLKILKLESQPDGRVKGLAAPSNLTMNQSLEGHSGAVHTIAWNEGHQKVTTSDSNGLIIVWMFYKSSWYEEMIKNSRSQVSDMKWNMDGQKICIAYEDGSVIVGSVDGNRIWGKELKLNLKAVAWSPDSKMILFGMKNGDIHIYDHAGNSVRRMDVPTPGPELAGLSWFSSRLLPRPEVPGPCLAVAFTNGRVFLLRDEADDRPIELDTRLRLRAFNWSHDGSMIAFAGHLTSQKDSDKDVNTVKFYSANGEHLRTLKVPGSDITACTWEGGSLRIALAVDSYIYFANVRPRYRWAYCGNTVVYAYNRPDRVENCVVFWDTKNNLRFIKYIVGVTHVAAAGEYCCIAHKPDQQGSNGGGGKCTLVLCNAIGTPLDTRDLDLEAEQVAMTTSHVVVASDRAVYTWQFKDPRQLAVMEVSEKRKAGAEKLFHIDEGAPVEGEGLNYSRVNGKEVRDRICALGVSAKLVVVARESGALLQFGLPSMALEVKHRLECTPYELQVNCSSTRIAIIDQSGVLTFFDLDKAASAKAPQKEDQQKQAQQQPQAPQIFERKDVWHMRFADDNPDLFAFMEKTRMYVMKGLEVEEPVSSSAYLCQFKDLEIKGVLLDEILKDCPSSPSQDYLLDMEVKALRDMRDLTEKSGIEQSLKFVEEHPHPRLWRLLAECALERQNLQVAEQAYVKCRDYAGVQLIKRLQNLTSDQLRKAEVAVHFGRFEAAEEIYLKADRKDLAVELCRTVGDWFRLVQLVKSSTGAGTDAVLMEAWEALGDHYSDRQSWQLAIDYYAQAQKEEKLAECHYLLEDYLSLEKVSLSLPDNHKLLPQLAAKFAAIGMGDQAVSAYVRCGLVKDAINTCVQLNQWTTAIELAKQHNLRDIDALLTQYANHLLEKNKLVNAVELYRKAGHFLEAAKHMHKLTTDEVKKGSSPMKIKKMFVLVGMLIEQYHEQSKTQAKSKAKSKRGEASTALAGLLEEDTEAVLDSRLMDGAWRGAEAYHFYLLAQRQLYANYNDAAMHTAMVLRDYEDILPARNIYSLIALCACANRAFGTCSKAFIKLETLSGASEAELDEYREMATEIFNRYSPKDQRTQQELDLEAMMEGESKIPICIVTGQAITSYQFWMCPMCKHSAGENEIARLKHCPLCHNVI